MKSSVHPTYKTPYREGNWRAYDRALVRRGDVTLWPIVDSMGLSIVGEGEWATAKHGGHGTRGWKKLHLGADRSGVRRMR